VGNCLEKDFFRRNVITIGGLVVFILVIFAIVNPLNSKQSVNEESLKQLKQENTQLKQEINKLKTEQSFYKNKYDNEISSLQATNEINKETIAKYQKSFEHIQSEIKNELVDSLSIFSPENTKKGDKIAGLTVSDLNSKESSNGTKSYHVNFTGEFQINGKLYINEADGGYTLVVEENLEKLPHSLQEFEGLSFNVTNDDELKKALGDKLDKLPLDIVGVFKNYSYNYVPETDWGNAAEFVRLISQN
jgi:cell division protein FtsB